ncbi:MAG TPA: hypothetical protein PLC65_20560 [Bacteroidia bacterium]|nr:hypothetical protein [Bacteroidia bacterium]HRD41032.1 hypothetical protein [Bacteroidia bacterium]
MKTTKRGDFCFYIRPGNYELIEYIWTTTNGFIATTQTQTITRTNTSADSTANSSQWFRFSVSPSSLIYVGTWQFKEEPISFIDEKDEADKKMKQNYGHFDFSKAKRSVPK